MSTTYVTTQTQTQQTSARSTTVCLTPESATRIGRQTDAAIVRLHYLIGKQKESNAYNHGVILSKQLVSMRERFSVHDFLTWAALEVAFLRATNLIIDIYSHVLQDSAGHDVYDYGTFSQRITNLSHNFVRDFDTVKVLKEVANLSYLDSVLYSISFKCSREDAAHAFERMGGDTDDPESERVPCGYFLLALECLYDIVDQNRNMHNVRIMNMLIMLADGRGPHSDAVIRNRVKAVNYVILTHDFVLDENEWGYVEEILRAGA